MGSLLLFAGSAEAQDVSPRCQSAADAMLGHSCIMANRLGVVTDEMPNLKAYATRLLERPACAEAFAA